MKPLNLNISKMKKIGGDEKSTTFAHPDGHQIRVAHSGLSKIHVQQMKKMPIHMAEGGMDISDMTAASQPNKYVPEVIKSDADTTQEQAQASPNASEGLNPPTETPQYGPSSDLASPQVDEDAAKEIIAKSSSTGSGDEGEDYSGKTNQAARAKMLEQQEQLKDHPIEQAADISDAPVPQPQGLVGQLQVNQNTLDNIHAQQLKNSDDYAQWAKDNPTDAKRVYHNMDTGQKIATAIGLLAGGFSTAAQNGGQNPAIKYLNDTIEKDIDAQKNDQSNNLNLFKVHNEALGNQEMAAQQTRNNFLQQAKIQFDQQMGNNVPGSMADLKAKAAAQQLNQEIAQGNYRMTLLQGGSSGAGDPAVIAANIIQDPKDREKALEEIKTAEDTARIAPQIMDAYDKAANNIHAVDIIPGTLSADQKNYMGLMNTTVKEIEGTARQAAMESLQKNGMPQTGDDANTKAVKRKFTENYLKSKTSAPFSRGHGIDLSKFPSTQINFPGQEVDRQLPNGKIGVFDQDTKKFLRYK